MNIIRIKVKGLKNSILLVLFLTGNKILECQEAMFWK